MKPQFSFWKEGKNIKTPFYHLPFMVGETCEDNDFCLTFFSVSRYDLPWGEPCYYRKWDKLIGKWALSTSWASHTMVPTQTTSSTNYY